MQVITLDIGGTSIKSALIQNFNILSKTKINTNADLGFEKIMESIFSSIDYHIPYLTNKTFSIGISCAGDIDPINGIVTFATKSLPNFTGLRLKEIIEHKYKVSVNLLNDAFCATIAEYELNENLNGKNIVMLTLGTGVGGGVILNSKILLGNNFKGCRLGHIQLHKNGRICPCGESGCVETYISANGLIKTAKDFGINENESNLVLNNSNRDMVKAVVESFTDDLIDTINILTNIFDPYAIVLGGGLVMTSEHWFDLLLKKNTKQVKIIIAKLQNDAGIFGAYLISANQNKYF